MTDRPVRVLALVWRAGSSGGVPRFQRDLALAVRDDPAVELRLVSVRPEDPHDREVVAPLAPVRYLGVAGPLSIRARLTAAARFRAVLRDERPDVVHVHSGTGWVVVAATLLARLRGRSPQVVLQVHDPPQTGRHSRWSDELERRLVAWLGWHPVVDCREVALELVEAWGADEADIAVAHLGIDVVAFRRDDAGRAAVRAELGVAPDTVVVAQVARFVPSKRMDRFVELGGSFRSSARCCFVAVGDGSERAELASRAEAMEADVRVVGRKEELVPWYSAADVYVSTSESEGFGLAVAEAMACELPVVALTTSGFLDLMDDGTTGVLVEQSDDAGLAEALRSVVEDPARRGELGRAGRARVEAMFSLAAMGARYRTLWREVAGL